jgi:hypothetical protein
MMNPQCQEMLKLLLDFVDGTLEHDRDEEFRRHLCGCLPCYVYLQTYETTIRITRSLPKCQMPKECEQRLLAMLEKEHQQ